MIPNWCSKSLKAATRWSYSISHFFSSCWFLACTWHSDPLLTPQLLDLVLESQKALEISQEHGSSSCWRWKKRKTASQDSSKEDLLSFLSLFFWRIEAHQQTSLNRWTYIKIVLLSMTVKVLCKQMASLDFKYWSMLQLYATKMYIKWLQMCN